LPYLALYAYNHTTYRYTHRLPTVLIFQKSLGGEGVESSSDQDRDHLRDKMARREGTEAMVSSTKQTDEITLIEYPLSVGERGSTRMLSSPSVCRRVAREKGGT
jgi:hypothetical protein